MEDDCWSIEALRCEQLGGFYRAKEEFNGVGAVVSYLNNKGEQP
jgi:hypothetical protein